MQSNAEFRNYHEREAARLRSLLSVATTAALRTRLLEQAEAHERLAADLEDLEAAVAEAEAQSSRASPQASAATRTGCPEEEVRRAASC